MPAQGSVPQEVEDSEPEFKRPPQRIVWRNVVLMSSLHLASLYALTLIPRSHPLTWLWSKHQYMTSCTGRLENLYFQIYRLVSFHFMCSHTFCNLTNSLFYSYVLLHIFCPGDHRRGTPAVGPQVIQSPGPTALSVGTHECKSEAKRS